jgi:hypothetical protein
VLAREQAIPCKFHSQFYALEGDYLLDHKFKHFSCFIGKEVPVSELHSLDKISQTWNTI